MRFVIPLLMIYPLTAQVSFAFESFPEFQSLTENEEAVFEGPKRLEPEMLSDVLAFSKMIDWEYAFLKNPLAADFSVGSISSRHFRMDNRVRFKRLIDNSLEFRITYFNDSHLERESEHFIPEIIFWFTPYSQGPKIGIGAYGEPALYKRNDDTGLALFIKPHDLHEIKVFNTFIDVTRTQRNDRSDRYIEPYTPNARGVVGRAWNEHGEFLEYGGRYETKTKWLFPDSDYTYQYWKTMGFVFGSKNISESLTLQLRAQWDRKFEAKNAGTSSTLTESEAWITTRSQALIRTVFNNKWTWGALLADRKWERNGEKVEWFDVIPHVWYKMNGFQRSGAQDFFWIGIDSLWHQADGPLVLRNNDDQVDQTFEERLNLVYDFSFRDQISLKLMATFDLDEFGSKRSWEGGNAQFKVHF